jgi:hypothetical protein
MLIYMHSDVHNKGEAMASKRTQKKPANPKQAEELFREGQRILAERPAAQPTSPATPATPPKPEKPVDYEALDPGEARLDWHHNDQQILMMRPMFIAEIVDELQCLDPNRLRRVRQYIRIERHQCGCTTPAEELITGLVHRYEHGITPADLERELDPAYTDGFRLNFEEALEEARHFQKLYPRLMAGGAE